MKWELYKKGVWKSGDYIIARYSISNASIGIKGYLFCCYLSYEMYDLQQNFTSTNTLKDAKKAFEKLTGNLVWEQRDNLFTTGEFIIEKSPCGSSHQFKCYTSQKTFDARNPFATVKSLNTAKSMCETVIKGRKQ